MEAIANTLRGRFAATVPGTLKVQYDNAPLIAPNNERWARFHVLPGETFQVETGSTARFRTTGIAKAVIHSPLELGDRDALQLAQTIVSAFRRVTVSGVTLRTPSIRNGGRDESWYTTVVDCPFYSDTIA